MKCKFKKLNRQVVSFYGNRELICFGPFLSRRTNTKGEEDQMMNNWLEVWGTNQATNISEDKTMEGQKSKRSEPVLVCSCCHNKMPKIEWLIQNRNLFLKVQEAGCLVSGCQYDRVLVKTLLQVVDCQPLPVCSHGGRSQVSLWSLFYKSDNPIYEGGTLMT